MTPITHIFQPILTGTDRPTELADYPAVHVQPVAWGEMDAFNHLNNVIYHRYTESARLSYLQAAELMANRGDLLTILASSNCQYLRPVTYPDTLLIGVKVKKLGNTTIVFECAFFSHAQQSLVALSESVLVRMNADMKKQSWSDAERQTLSAFEGQEL